MILARGGHWGLVILHAAAAGAGLLVNSRSSPFAALRVRITDAVLLAVLVVWPLLYFEIPLLISAVGSTFHDPLVQRWEQMLFRSQPSHALALHLPWWWLSELLHAGYLAYYPAIFAPTLVLLWRRQTRAATRLVIAVGVVYGLCWTIYAFFPVQGPRYLWPMPPALPTGPMRTIAVHLLAAGSSRGAAFPSSHMAATTVQAVVIWPADRGLSVVLSVIALLIGGGAVYGGFHYGVDVVTGAALALLVGMIAAHVSPQK